MPECNIDIFKLNNYFFALEDRKLSYKEIKNNIWNVISFNKILDLSKNTIKLWNISKISVWIKTWNDAIFISEKSIDGYLPFIEWKDIYKYSSIII